MRGFLQVLRLAASSLAAGVVLALLAMPLGAQWTVSPGVGVFTLLRLEMARETDARTSSAFAVGVHPLAVPSLEALMRRQVGSRSATGAYSFVDVAALGFLPGTQFADGADPGVGAHLTWGRRWPWRTDRFVQLRLGLGVYLEVEKGGGSETSVLPVLGLDIGRRRLRGDSRP